MSPDGTLPPVVTNGPVTIAFEGDGPWRNRRQRRADAAKARQKGRVRK